MTFKDVPVRWEIELRKSFVLESINWDIHIQVYQIADKGGRDNPQITLANALRA